MTRLRLEFIHEYPDRHGKLRRSLRRRGSKQIPLPGSPGSVPEFMQAYQAGACTLLPFPQRSAHRRTKPGTMNAAHMCGCYQIRGVPRTGVGNTAQVYRHVLERMQQARSAQRQIARARRQSFSL